MPFKIKIEPDAFADIQEAVDWYNAQRKNLGRDFHKKLDEHFEALKSNPYFQVRYDQVRCLPMKKFPFMIHYTLDEKAKAVIIRAVLSTHREPKLWKERG